MNTTKPRTLAEKDAALDRAAHVAIAAADAWASRPATP